MSTLGELPWQSNGKDFVLPLQWAQVWSLVREERSNMWICDLSQNSYKTKSKLSTLYSLDCKEIKPVDPKGNQSWIFIGRTDTEAPILWPPDVKRWLIRKKPWCWERLKAGGERDDRGWDGWMASLTQRTWVWASSGRWWKTRKPGMLESMGSQRVGHDWVTEQQLSTDLKPRSVSSILIFHFPFHPPPVPCHKSYRPICEIVDNSNTQEPQQDL